MTDENQTDDDEADDDGHVDPEVPSGAKTASEGGKVLTPEELEIEDSEYVEPLDDDGRFVVSPGGGPPNVSRSASESDTPGSDRRGGPEPRADTDRSDTPEKPSPQGPRETGQHDTPVSPEAARTLLARELARTNASYGIDIVARFEGETVRHRTVSNDVVGTFENLLRWYAGHVADDTPADEVLEILLREADVGSGTDPNLAELLEAHDLDRQDSIADLVEAIRVESDRER